MFSTKTTIFNWILGSDGESKHPVFRQKAASFIRIFLLTHVFLWLFFAIVLKSPDVLYPLPFWLYVIAHGLSLCVFIWTRNFIWTAFLLVFSLAMFFTHFAFISGGLSSPAIFWLAILPFIAGVLCGKKESVYTFGFSLVCVLIIGFQFSQGRAYPVISPDLMLWSRALSALGILILITRLTLFLITIFNKSEDKLRAQTLTKQNLLRILAHDIATPLNVGLLRVEMMQMQSFNLDNKEKIRKELGIIENALFKIGDMINTIKQFEAMDSGKVEIKLEKVELKPLLLSAEAMVEDWAIKKGVQVQIECEKISVLAIANLLESQVINNLLTNAIKFSQSGQTIKLIGREAADGKAVLIYVIDQGQGIPSELRLKLFDPESQTSRLGTNGEKGTGFGLPIVKSTIDFFKGQIHVVSKHLTTETFNPDPVHGSILNDLKHSTGTAFIITLLSYPKS